jgi:hypothetical protein
MARYNLNDRPMPGGSMDPRLSYKTYKELNAKIGAPKPDPVVRATSRNNPVISAAGAATNDARRRAAGLTSRFIKD